MKKVIVAMLVLLGCGSTQSFAQDTVKTLIHIPHISYVGIYVAPEFQYGQINSQFTSWAGGSAMISFNRRFAAGITGMHTADPNFSGGLASGLAMRSSYGGLKLEYTVKPSSALHISFPLSIGGGMVNVDSQIHTLATLPDSFGHHDRRHGGGGMGRGNRPMGEQFGYVQPGVNVEANLLPFVKFYVGASYRIAFTQNTAAVLSASGLQGFSAVAGVKVGLFNIATNKDWRRSLFHQL